uniref:Uncharacterized protein n=1 Tax=Romanomermis culicivorax TaxID=13658 RepID=A0A915JNC1_ROMCU
MHTKLVSTELGKNSKEAEYCLVQHKNEYGPEIDARQSAVDQFVANGNQMVQAKHLLADEIEEKVAHLELSYKNLKATWRERLDLYELNLDVQLWKEQAENLESFLQENESRIVDESDWSNLDDNILNIERKLVEHNDFITLLEGQKNRVDNVKRLTMLEKVFGSQLDRENSRKMSENVLKEKLRKEQIRTLEKQKVLQ